MPSRIGENVKTGNMQLLDLAESSDTLGSPKADGPAP
jgi:hypothetical protein